MDYGLLGEKVGRIILPLALIALGVSYAWKRAHKKEEKEEEDTKEEEGDFVYRWWKKKGNKILSKSFNSKCWKSGEG